MKEKRVRVAVVGVGRVGVSHLHGIVKCSATAELAGVVETNKELADKVANEFGTKAFYSLEQALAANEIDAYVVSLPHFAHFPVGCQILKAKKHLLVEKPLGINLDEVEGFIRVAGENGVYCMSGQSRRFYTAIRQAKTKLAEIDGPTNLLYNFACIFTKETAPAWWREEKKSGGLVIGMLGSHSLDMTLWMYGDAKPVRVYAESRKITDVFEGDDAATVTIKFDNGCLAANYLSICNSPLKHECLIEGRRGSIEFNHVGDHSGVIGTSATHVLVNGQPFATDDEPDCFTNEMAEFTSAILEGREPSTSARNVYPTYLVLEAAKNSAETHQPVDIVEYAKKRGFTL